MEAKSTLSVVVPVSGDAASLERLVQQVAACGDKFQNMGGLVTIAKLLFVLDGPTDDAYSMAMRLSSTYDWVHAITLSRHFGPHAATNAGVLHTSSDWVATVDAELGHSPSELPPMLATAVLERADVVYGRADPLTTSSRSTSSQSGHWFGFGGRKGRSSFRIIRGPIARAAASTAGYDADFDVSLQWHTQRAVCASASPGWRTNNDYNNTIGVGPSNGVVRLASVTGLSMVILAALGLAWLIIAALAGPTMQLPSWLPPTIPILMASGVLALSAAMISAVTAKLLQQSQGRPTFLVVDRSIDLDLVSWAASVAATPTVGNKPRSHNDSVQTAKS